MLHTTIKQKTFLAAAFIACSFTFWSFTLGGDSYSVYLNSKLIFTAYQYSKTDTHKPIDLSLSNMNDKLVVEYSQCGVTGTGRRIMTKDENDNLVKEWKFADEAGKAMAINVKDILQSGNKAKHLKLYYASEKYLPNGRFLTTMNIDDKTGTKSSVAKR